jgi:DNA-binding NarL/FixJ family response regulator
MWFIRTLGKIGRKMTVTLNIINNGEIVNGFIYTVLAGIALAILNFISTIIYRYFSGKSVSFFWQEQQSPLEKVFNPKSEKQIKQRIKILLIDNDKSLNVEQFNEEGYSMEYWPKVKSLKELNQGNYDIIILDIKDVAKDYSEEDGFGVLKSIKQNNPHQIVIAFSAHSYDFSKKKFWDMADEAIDKPAGFIEMKEVLDNVILKSFNAKEDIRKLRTRIVDINLSRRQLYIIEKRIATSIKKQNQLRLDDVLTCIHNSLQRNQVKNMLLRFINLYTDYETE